MLSLHSRHGYRSALEEKINLVHVDGPAGAPRKDVSLVRVVQSWNDNQRYELLCRLSVHGKGGIAVHVLCMVGDNLNRVDTHACRQVEEFNFRIGSACIVL
jgi:hypothetical protein